MIVKGASRSGPRQLAVYLMRVERWDTGEPAELLELRSPWAASMEDDSDRHEAAQNLIEAFRDWQTLVEGTKQGRDGLYHCEISPEAHYAREMTKEEWLLCVDFAAQALGLQDQPRAVVLHAGKDDRPHLHVVWQRTDIETMKVISDAYNYVAHEKASHRMELEFGHEIIPGKHAKRDRKKQPEFPRQKLTQDEDQYQKRTGLSKEERQKQIATLHAAADNGPAFKAALEDAGYILAQGDRGYIIVDQKGGHSALSRNVRLKEKEINAFMKGVELEKLPTIEEAKAVQSDRRRTVSKSDGQPKPVAETEKKGVEASKFLEAQTTQPRAEPVQPQEDAELEAIKKALAQRQADDLKKSDIRHTQELRQLEAELDRESQNKLAIRRADELEALTNLKDEIRERTTLFGGIIEAFENKLNPQRAEERANERRREIAQLKRRQKKERADFAALLEQTRQLEIENLKERQAQQRRDQQQRHIEEAERHIRDYEKAKRLREQIEAEQRELEKTESLREGPPPPKLGK